VFSESTISDKPARSVASETGARYGGTLCVDSLSDARGPAPTDLKLLETTVESIAKGFRTFRQESASNPPSRAAMSR
jgi:manganese/iron transport system substrate-binding protein